jgi:hypothetical protein
MYGVMIGKLQIAAVYASQNYGRGVGYNLHNYKLYIRFNLWIQSV